MKDYFLKPSDPMQKRYEALRASFVENISANDVAERFGYSVHTINALRRDFKANMLQSFFQPLKPGPKDQHSDIKQLKDRIVELRKLNYSISEIEEVLVRDGNEISDKTINDILKAEGFARLFRRTGVERRIALQQGKNPAEVADISMFSKHKQISTKYGGVFLFIPMILELDLHTLMQSGGFYGSKIIPAINYLLSFLALKLIGKERLFHVNDLNFDYGLGSFAGLNVLPKVAALTQYSYQNPHTLVRQFLIRWNKMLISQGYIKGNFINLDFHSIPHWGEDIPLDNHWIPTRGKSMKSVLSFFAQDLETTYLCYSNGQIAKGEEADEILNFVKFYKTAHNKYPQCLVFDSKLTTYENLNILNKDYRIKFITLRRRGKNILKEIQKVSYWKKIKLDIPKRKYKQLKVWDHKTTIQGYEDPIRQIIITGNGRELPMFLITNDFSTSIKDILHSYARRWLVENNIQENIDFFSLNALSSEVIVKVDFDIAITIIANTLYKMLAKKFSIFKKVKPKTLYRCIIEGEAQISLTEEEIIVSYGKKAFNPMIMDWAKSIQNVKVPWMKNKILTFKFD